MVEAGAKEVTEDAGRRGARSRARRDQADRRARSTTWRRKPARRSCTVADEGDRRTTFYREVEEQGARAARPRRCASATSSRTTTRVDQVLDELVASLPEGEAERKADAKAHLQGAQGKGAARRGPRARRAARRPQVRRGPPDLDRDGRPAARHGSAVFTRGETQALVTVHARHGRRRAEDRDASRARRGRASCSTTTSRRSRSAKSAFLRGPGRREVGHGALAERALAPMMPGRGDSSPTPSASSRTSSSRTARRRWRRSAAARWR